MKKNKGNGFLMMETLIVTTFISAVVIYIFIQFKLLYQSYDVSFNYNTVNSLYSTNQMKKFILSTNYSILITNLGDKKYLDITDCPVNDVIETNYCKELIQSLNIKNLYFTKEDLTDFISYTENSNLIDEDLKKFFGYINYEKDTDNYRIIVSFNDNTFASLSLK